MEQGYKTCSLLVASSHSTLKPAYTVLLSPLFAFPLNKPEVRFATLSSTNMDTWNFMCQMTITVVEGFPLTVYVCIIPSKKNSSILSKRLNFWHLSNRPVVVLSPLLQLFLYPFQVLWDIPYCINILSQWMLLVNNLDVLAVAGVHDKVPDVPDRRDHLFLLDLVREDLQQLERVLPQDPRPTGRGLRLDPRSPPVHIIGLPLSVQLYFCNRPVTSGPRK